MSSSGIRSISLGIIAVLGIAACAGGSNSLQPTPAVGTAPNAIRPNVGSCKALPRIDARSEGVALGSRGTVVHSDCSIRSTHRSALRANSGSYQLFDVPDAIQVSNCSPSDVFNDCGTFGISVNASGTVAGYYLNDSSQIASYARTPGGKYTTFQAGSGLGTYAWDISDDGTIAGQYFDAHGISAGFLRSRRGSFLRYQAPWASQIPDDSVSQGTSTAMVNPQGESAGIYFDDQGLPHGFIRHRNGSFVQIIPAGSILSTVCIVCLNNRGTTAGNYTGSDGITKGYVRTAGGKITTIAVQGAVVTQFSGVNNSNRLVGFYVDQYSVVWGLIVGGNKRQVVFQEPHASQTYGNGTQPEAINDAGDITGLYSDDQGNVHGFYRSSAGAFSEFDPPGSVFTEPFSINSARTVTGYWYDAQGATHGFIWKPR